MIQRKLTTLPSNMKVKIVTYGDLRKCPDGSYVDTAPWLVGKTSTICESTSHDGLNRYKLSGELFKGRWFTEEQLRPIVSRKSKSDRIRHNQ